MATVLPLPRIDLDGSSTTPLFRQIHRALRDAVLAGTMTAGMRLPPSRVLARTLSVSRQTVVAAYEQLIADGILVARVGRGSFVADAQPLPVVSPGPSRAPDGKTAPARPPTSLRSERFVTPETGSIDRKAGVRAFRTGVPALEAFPFAAWGRIAGRHWRRHPRDLGYEDVAGFPPLRALLAEHLRTTRGMTCYEDQIVVTTGMQQALHLAASVLLDPGDSAWIENPGYRWARSALCAAGARLHPVTVDEEGMRVEDGVAACPQARLAYVTPSHQCPLGATMSLRRRLELLAWAQRADGWIVEDDYDSEYRYDSPVLASLQSMDRSGCVVYVGTFSKVLFPGLRLGYLVSPPSSVDSFRRAKAALDRHTAAMPQRILADFIAEGHFHRHLRRTRDLYDERRHVLLDAMRDRLSDLLRPGPFDAGLQVATSLLGEADDVDVARRAALRGIEVSPLSPCYLDQPAGRPLRASGLLLGFAGVAPRQIRDGVSILRQVLEEWR